MSSGTLPEHEPQSSLSGSPTELAPSNLVQESASFARWLGYIGWMFAALGGMVVALNITMGPRVLPSIFGYIALFIGLPLMLYHAARDGDVQVRRYFGGVGLFFLFLALIATLIPGAPAGVATRSVGYFFLPYGAVCLLIGLAFLMTFALHETDRAYRDKILFAEFLVGIGLSVACFLVGIINPPFLLGAGLVIGLIGLLYLTVFTGQMGADDGVGYNVSLMIGAMGVLAVLYAAARSAVPVLGMPERSTTMFIIGAGLLIGAGAVRTLIPKASGAALRPTLTLGLAALGLLSLILGGVGATKMLVGSNVPPFFVPYGLILTFLGLLYVVVALGNVSDSQFIVMTRRELASFFYSPIAYMVLIGFMLAGWLNYYLFIRRLAQEIVAAGGVMEPILSLFIYNLFPVMAVAFVVPALTMRLFSEERRTGTIEVMFTVAVRESTTVLSKFFAAWIFYMILWLPWAGFLIVLRIEGGSPFDYRPLLGFILSLGATGAAFVAMGLFFSSLTKNQIIAAVLTFAGMMAMVFFHIGQRLSDITGTVLESVFHHLSFLDLWVDSLSGKLALSDVFLHLSVAGFWLYLTIKVLEARRWS